MLDFLRDHNNRSFIFFAVSVIVFLVSAIYIAYSVRHIEFVKHVDHTDF